MTSLGVFRDDFYNAACVLTSGQFTSTSQAAGVLPATSMAGANEVYVGSSGATALTTDTAAAVIAQLQQAVATAYKNSINGSGSNAGAANGVNPPSGLPNLFNFTFYLSVRNTNGGTLTLTAGAGVTITGTATIATGVQRNYLVSVTSPTTITMQDLGGSAVT